MGETGIRQQVIEEIQALAQKYNVSKVILFGSRARGISEEPAILIWQ
nr:nucleotidyltransferase domain-containing protein [Bariatricus massiliensis]